MRVPYISDLQNDTNTIYASKTAAIEPTTDAFNASADGRRPRGFGRPSDPFKFSNGQSRSTTDKQDRTKALDERQSSCPNGKSFFRCSNGYTGCCSHDPCSPGAACRDDNESSTQASKATASTETRETPTRSVSTMTASTTSQDQSSKTSTTPSSILTASSSGRSTSTTTSWKTSVTPPSCPRANNYKIVDPFKVGYIIHCNKDNTQDSYDEVSVGVGGYAECFSSCSRSDGCAGFTYVGLDSGTCYLKSKMPKDSYVVKAGSNYISCAKVHPNKTADGTNDNGKGDNPKNVPVGAIVGGVLGGIAFLILLLVLIAFLAKRRRKKIEQRRATIVTHIKHGPIETQHTDSWHQRTGSTSHDVFAPYGGYYRGVTDLQADSRGRDDGRQTIQIGFEAPHVQDETELAVLPTSTHRPSIEDSRESVAMLDSTPIKRPVSRSSGSRSPRFHEHIAELEDTGSPPTPTSYNRLTSAISDSPTLGRQASAAWNPSLADDVRRRQHLMAWNNYDANVTSEGTDVELDSTMVPKAPPAPRSLEEVSPDLSNEPRDSKFVVSPLGSLEQGRNS